MNYSIEVLEKVGKRNVTQKTVSQLCFVGLVFVIDYLGYHNAIYVSFPHEIGLSFKPVDPTFLPLVALAEVVEDELKLFRRSTEHDFILATVELVIIDLK